MDTESLEEMTGTLSWPAPTQQMPNAEEHSAAAKATRAEVDGLWDAFDDEEEAFNLAAGDGLEAALDALDALDDEEE